MHSELHGRHVLVLGHGISGQAMARWCARLGACVTVADTRELSPQACALQRELAVLGQHEVIHSPFDPALMARHDWALICKSPGLSPQQLAIVSDIAAIGSVLVVGELFLFALGLKQVYANLAFKPKVLAITGTNGKTTTTSLTGHLLRRAGFSVAVAGNIGPSMLDVLSSFTPDALPECWVLELSSFQLDGVPIGAEGFEPDAATVLNITQDHLDWHGSMTHYAFAKYRVFGRDGVRVLNRDDPLVMAGSKDARSVLTFGMDQPERIGDWGLENINGMTWLVRLVAEDDHGNHKKQRPAEITHLQRLMPADALRIRGRHNAANALAALALATAIGAPLAPMLHGLREYRGEPHRVESVGIVNGVEFFDDSKGTNVGATLAAIQGLGAERRLIVILGGDGKGQDFSPLASAIQIHVKAIVLIGRDAPLIEAALVDTNVPLLHAADMSAAVFLAANQAQNGDAVLMSPACASLDMFKNYAHRAEVFCQAVKDWSLEQGHVGELG